MGVIVNAVLRVSGTDFIDKDSVHFDAEGTDRAIESYCAGGNTSR